MKKNIKLISLYKFILDYCKEKNIIRDKLKEKDIECIHLKITKKYKGISREVWLQKLISDGYKYLKKDCKNVTVEYSTLLIGNNELAVDIGLISNIYDEMKEQRTIKNRQIFFWTVASIAATFTVFFQILQIISFF